MVCVILDSHFFRFVCRTIFIISSMINVCGYAFSHTIDTFPFYYITFSCFMCTGTLSTDWGFTIIFFQSIWLNCYVTNFDSGDILQHDKNHTLYKPVIRNIVGQYYPQLLSLYVGCTLGSRVYVSCFFFSCFSHLDYSQVVLILYVIFQAFIFPH